MKRRQSRARRLFFGRRTTAGAGRGRVVSSRRAATHPSRIQTHARLKTRVEQPTVVDVKQINSHKRAQMGTNGHNQAQNRPNQAHQLQYASGPTWPSLTNVGPSRSRPSRANSAASVFLAEPSSPSSLRALSTWIAQLPKNFQTSALRRSDEPWPRASQPASEPRKQTSATRSESRKRERRRNEESARRRKREEEGGESAPVESSTRRDATRARRDGALYRAPLERTPRALLTPSALEKKHVRNDD